MVTIILRKNPKTYGPGGPLAVADIRGIGGSDHKAECRRPLPFLDDILRKVSTGGRPPWPRF